MVPLATYNETFLKITIKDVYLLRIFNLPVHLYVSDGAFKLQCKSKRTEIIFPVIKDGAGHLMPRGQDQQFLSRDLIQVTLEWRRAKLNVLLYQNEVTSPTSHSEWTTGNETFAKFMDRLCFYQGYVKGQRSSYAALSTCEGLVSLFFFLAYYLVGF